jgi:hypothetical protein
MGPGGLGFHRIEEMRGFPEPFQKAISLDEDSPFVHFKAGGLLFDNGDSHRNPEIIGAYRTPYSS